MPIVGKLTFLGSSLVWLKDTYVMYIPQGVTSGLRNLHSRGSVRQYCMHGPLNSVCSGLNMHIPVFHKVMWCCYTMGRSRYCCFCMLQREICRSRVVKKRAWGLQSDRYRENKIKIITLNEDIEREREKKIIDSCFFLLLFDWLKIGSLVTFSKGVHSLSSVSFSYFTRLFCSYLSLLSFFFPFAGSCIHDWPVQQSLTIIFCLSLIVPFCLICRPSSFPHSE